jgi:hypothetical protein
VPAGFDRGICWEIDVFLARALVGVAFPGLTLGLPTSAISISRITMDTAGIFGALSAPDYSRHFGKRPAHVAIVSLMSGLRMLAIYSLSIGQLATGSR